MDRRAGLIGVGIVAACGAPAPAHPADHRVQVVARGTMAYGVAFAGDRLVSVELIERFALVIRGDGGAAEQARLDLGRAEDDWPALAAAGDRAWVGGDTGEVVEVDLTSATERARWPVGAAVTGLATDGAHVAIADATDGGLADVEARAGRLVTTDAAGDAAGWAVPSLAPAPVGPPPRFARAGRRVLLGDRVIVEVGGAVRDLALADDGTLAVAAWIADLDDPSVILVR